MQKQIDKYGLIGKDISYSFSKKFFTQKFINEGLNNCSYENYDISSISELFEVINDTEIKIQNLLKEKKKIIENDSTVRRTEEGISRIDAQIQKLKDEDNTITY